MSDGNAELVEELRFHEGLLADFSFALDKYGETAGNAVLASDLAETVTKLCEAAAAIQSLEADKAALLDRVRILEEALTFGKEHLSGTKEAGALAQIQAIEARAAIEAMKGN